MTEPRWRLTVDRRKCHSSGFCVGIAGDRFELTPGGARPVREDIPEDEDVLEAAECCPLQAIRVADLATGAEIAPEPV
ncbi:ferredoxin [Microbispora siamensis]|uniref:Ferredoxin n=1 Tax=Microbispora siamensis TaxID=564413 RepID=A0ABQ4GZK1_9ACTN|nr:ferredoxin [Microbispora siamensis]GIH66845.1 hypothetical protein Msi02_76620 [Microbispora siamensis]